MKPFRKKRDHQVDLPTSGLTGRQLTAISVAFALAIVLVPVGARAAQIVNAIITDPTNASNQAHVDGSGNLQVAGQVTVDSATPVSVTSLDDPGRHPFESTSAAVTFDPLDEFARADFLVPAGKRLVLELVSVMARLPTGQRLLDARIELFLSGASHTFVLSAPTFTGTGPITPLRDVYVVSQDLTLYVGGNSGLRVTAERDSTLGEGFLFVSISGYLLDCSASPCN